MLCEERKGEQSVFTYEWLGVPSESGVRPVLDRSFTSSTSLKAAIAHAKSSLKEKTIFPAGQTYGVRILNNDSVLVWVWDVNDA
jgi:hypothetical protein